MLVKVEVLGSGEFNKFHIIDLNVGSYKETKAQAVACNA